MKRKMVDINFQVWTWNIILDDNLRLNKKYTAPACIESLNAFRIISIGHGFSHSLFLTRDGSVLSCGANDVGQLGRGKENSTLCSIPTLISALQSHVVRDIQVGSHFAVAVNDSGQVLSWGDNSVFQLGRDNVDEYGVRVIPHMLKYSVKQVSCGSEHVLALCEDSALMAWGSNCKGQLGLGFNSPTSKAQAIAITCNDVGSKSNPVKENNCSNSAYVLSKGNLPQVVTSLSGLAIRQVVAGGWHSMILTWSGAVYSWGFNQHGQLGTGSAELLHLWPTQVRTLRSQRVCFLSAGSLHSAALTLEGGVFTFGCSCQYQLGHGRSSDELLPRKVVDLMGTPICQLACGRICTLALTAEHPARLFYFGLDNKAVLPLVGPWNTLKTSAANRKPAEKGVKSATPASAYAVTVQKIFASEDQCSVIVAHGQKVRAVDQRQWLSTEESLLVLDSSLPSSFIHASSWTCLPSIFDVKLAKMLETAASAESLSDEVSSAIVNVISSTACLSASFLASTHFNASRTNSGLNLDLAVTRFSALRVACERHAELQRRTLNVFLNKLIPSIRRRNFPDVEALRVFLILPCCHFMLDVSQWSTLHLPFSASWTNLDKQPQMVLSQWLKELPPRHFGRMIRIFNSVILHILNLPSSGSEFDKLHKQRGIAACLEFLQILNDANCGVAQPIVPYHMFYISELKSKVDIPADYCLWFRQCKLKGEIEGDFFSYCRFPFIFDGQAKCVLLQVDAKLQMEKAVRDAQQHNLYAMMASPVAFLGIDPINPLFVLVVHRENLLQEVLNEFMRHPICDYKKPLKVVFAGEDAVDDGGPKKEFFLLILRAILSPAYGMFKLFNDSRCLWFNSESLETSTTFYELIGVICGLAIYNNIIVDLNFPLALFKLLLGRPSVNLEDLKELEPVIGSSLQQILDYEDTNGDFVDVFNLTFEIRVESFDTFRLVSLKNNGANVVVTTDNRQEYVELYVNWVFRDSCNAQFKAFSNGFHKVCGGDVLNLFQPVELQAMMTGNDDYDWQELERNCDYNGEYWAKHPTIVLFWQIFHQFSLTEKKKFLLFLTGCDKVPMYGMSAIKLIIQPAGGGDQFLPVAHTCYNLLDLPKYSTHASMLSKLTLAIEQTEGFALV